MTLLDTNAIIWLLASSARLGQRANVLINRALSVGEAAFSTISIWEIGMLSQKGRIPAGGNAGQWREQLLTAGFVEIAVYGSIAVRAGSLEDMNGDPADRIIVATALDGNHRLVTSDRNILEWPHELDRFDARR